MLASVRLVRDSREVVEATDDFHLVRAKRGLHPEGASSPTLARKAVTDRHHQRIPTHRQAELSAVAGGFSFGHCFTHSARLFVTSSAGGAESGPPDSLIDSETLSTHALTATTLPATFPHARKS